MSVLSTSPGGPIRLLLKSWSEASGRTIKTVTEETVSGAWNDQFLVFRFTDGSGIVIKYYENDGGGGYDGDPDPLDGHFSQDRRQRDYFGIDSLEEYTKGEEGSDNAHI